MDAYHTELARQRAEGRHDWDRLGRAAEHALRRGGFITPVTLPVVPGPEQVAAFHRAKVLRRNAQLVALGAVIVACLAAMLFGGCATRQTPVSGNPPVVVLSERFGSTAACVIDAVVGQRPTAATLPGLPTIVFQPADAEDPCLLAHEAVHRADQREMGAAPWAGLYVWQLADCERSKPRATCLRVIPLEAAAYAAQHACSAARASR